MDNVTDLFKNDTENSDKDTCTYSECNNVTSNWVTDSWFLIERGMVFRALYCSLGCVLAGLMPKENSDGI